jgi:hypothetical protein
MSVKPYLNQDYEYLKYQHLRANKLFTDDKFPPNYSSIDKLSKPSKNEQIYWKRPHDLVDDPKFIVDGIDPGDLHQGGTGNCWFISAASTLASIPEYCKFVIPSNQTFEEGDYAGIFHFRFFQFGEWLDVVVDDLLPVNENDELIYCSNPVEVNEFFGPLFEKAYAKLASCYEFLNMGDPNMAMTDLTGAVCESFDITKCISLTNRSENDDATNEEEDADDYDESYLNSTDLESLWTFIKRSHKMRSLMNASFNSSSEHVLDENDCLPNGLVSDHAYSMLEAVEFKSNGKQIRLLKLRNPLGTAKSWKGAWSYQSKKWRNLEQSIKDRYNLDLNVNGDFYISYQDFVKNFEQLDVAHIHLGAFYDEYSSNSARFNWICKQHFGQFVKGKNAGGSGELFWQNPQYLITIESNPNNEEDMTSLIIGLMQPYSAPLRYQNNGEYFFHSIRFDVYSANVDSSKIYEHKSVKRKFRESQLEHVDSSGEYTDSREATRRVNLYPGNYVIIPSTSEENVNLQYVLRVFFDKFSCSSQVELF